MNERIREIALEASIPWPDQFNTKDGSNQLTKFAQLIAEDCAAYADEMWPHQKEFKGQLNIGLGIRRKFDVP
jgi:hypothetical protein